MENFNEVLHKMVDLLPWREEVHRNEAHAVIDAEHPAPTATDAVDHDE